MTEQSNDYFGGRWSFRVRWPAELAAEAGMHQVDVVCDHHGHGDPTQVDLLTALPWPDGGWRVQIADSAYVVQADEKEVDFTGYVWDLADGASDLRRRFRFICGTCGNETPARGEKLDDVVGRLADHGVRSITVDQLRARL